MASDDAEKRPTMKTAEDLVEQCGGNKLVKKVLIANNGISAVKAMRSMRKWLYKVLGNEKAVTFVVLATPDDMKINAEYIRLGDQFEEVPGGSNNHNYANVDLIIDLAERTKSDAVWAGWGHASENPRLPRGLEKSKIAFMGPHEKAMHDLGDKIASTLIAQSAKVPCVPWSGDGIIINYERDGLNDEIFQKACISSLEDLQTQIKRIGFPVMLKASEGGGGKGIRKIVSEDEVESAYRQVQGEVPGSPIFLMRMVKNCHHLEVQVVADSYNDVICLYGRDCSVQRRHQKIIEEAPAIVAPADVRLEMERAAIRLAKAVKYVGVGTVEYLYSPESNEFYFLELNPRLQVEHPTTEQVTNVNLPAVQLCIAMGIPLYRIPDIRAFYGREPFGNSPIVFEDETPVPPAGHVIACRITGENASDGFKPTSGRIQQLNFRSAPNVWGYFSVSAQDGGLHEFADSQFGHLFAHGVDREDARKSIILGLKELCIRGDVHTPVEYLISLLQTQQFKQNQMDTSSLDTLINAKSIREEKPKDMVVALCGAVYRGYNHFTEMSNHFAAQLAQGHIPTTSLVPVHSVDLIYNQIKYRFSVTRTGPSKLALRLRGPQNDGDKDSDLGSDELGGPIDAEFRSLGGDTLLVLMDGKSHVCQGKEEVEGLRLFIDDQMCMFAADYDPTVIRLTTSGKLVRYLVEDGSRLAAGTPFAEMEVMKMYLPVAIQEAGKIHLVQNEGAQLQAGDIIGRLTLDNPGSVSKAAVYDGKLPVVSPARTPPQKLQHCIQAIFEQLLNITLGYLPTQKTDNFTGEVLALCRMCISPPLSFLVLREKTAEVLGRIPDELSRMFSENLEEYRKVLREFGKAKGIATEDEDAMLGEMEKMTASLTFEELGAFDSPAFPKQIFKGSLAKYLKEIPSGEHGRLIDGCRQVTDAEEAFEAGNRGYTQATLQRLLQQYSTLDETKDSNEGGEVAIDYALFKNKCSRAVELVKDVISAIQGLGFTQEMLELLSQISRLYGKGSVEVSLLARQVLMDMKSLSYADRMQELQSTLSAIAKTESSDEKEKAGESDFHYETVKSDQKSQSRMNDLVNSLDSLFHFVLPIFGTDVSLAVKKVALQLYIERSYRAYQITDLAFYDDDTNDQVLMWSRFRFQGEKSRQTQQKSGSVMQATEKADLWTEESDSEATKVRTAQFLVFKTLEDAGKGLPAALEKMKADKIEGSGEGVLILTLMEMDAGFTDEEATSQLLSKFLQERKGGLAAANVGRVTVALNHSGKPVDYFTFFSSRGYEENDLLRHMDPTLGDRLEIDRMSNYNLKYIPLKMRPTLLYYGEDKEKGKDDARVFVRTLVRGSTDANDVLDKNRLLSFVEQRLSECIKSLGVVLDKKEYSHARNNHIFLRILSTIAYDPEAINGVIKWLGSRYGTRLFRLRVSALELRCRLSTGADISQTIPVLFEVKNPTSFKFHVHAYVEATDSETGKGTLYGLEGLGLSLGPLHGLSYRCPHGTITPLQKKRYFCQGLSTTYAYDFLELFDVAVRKEWTNFADTVKRATDKKEGREPVSKEKELLSPDPFSPLKQPSAFTSPYNTTPTASSLTVAQLLQKEKEANASATTKDLLYSVELTLNPDFPKDKLQDDAFTSMDRLVPVSRPIGQNDIGMVAWLVHFYTPQHPDKDPGQEPSVFNIDEDGDDAEGSARHNWDLDNDGKKLQIDSQIWDFLERNQYPGAQEAKRKRRRKGRWVVLIANDLTHFYGSFGPKEDHLFFCASRMARLLGLPRIYLSSNSGARIGLAKEVQELFKVSWVSSENPKAGFDYLYLTDKDYQHLLKKYEGKKVVVVEKMEGPGCGNNSDEKFHWKVTDVIGATDGLGVENLQGSGMIAGETSRAYDETFTITLVTGRSVGIGAYLVRLGQRTVQNQGPIILTGAPALNKVLGKDVYLSNVQLGGPQIMYNNGVSHAVVNDDLRGLHSILQWVSYIPACIGASPSVSNTLDPFNRRVPFLPSPRPYDPRGLMEGATDPDSGRFLEGLLDVGSFQETLAGWAQTVVCGRGRLGGIPVGVLAVETRSREEIIPADPALPTSRQEVRQQPGQVWCPNTAFKTAQAIQDFNRGEELPLLILANWRGFSGGMRDMFNEILKYGAYIVDALKEYKQPVFIYLPPYAELRGGAWAVLDPTINKEMMEMYVDPRARGGILEPSGTVEIKFRKADLLKTMHRVDEKLIALKQQPSTPEVRQQISEREKELLPIYQQIAIQFADLHDRSGRMVEKKCVRGVVEWESAREYLYNRLVRRLEEEKIIKIAGERGLSRAEAKEMLEEMLKGVVDDDVVVGRWLVEGRAEVVKRLDEEIGKRTTKKMNDLLLAHSQEEKKKILLAILEKDPSLKEALLQ